MTTRPDPIRPTDDEARRLGRSLIAEARFAALGVIDPESGAPLVTRIGLVALAGEDPLTLISDLSAHTAALLANPVCCLLLGEPGARGDPLTHPRLSLQARAEAADKAGLRARYLGRAPKAALYYDFADFRLVRFRPLGGHLNGGFGRAFRLEAGDLAADPGGGTDAPHAASGHP